MALSAYSATAQDIAPPAAAVNAKVKVSVADTAAPPEWELSVPVALDVEHETEAARVTMRVRYPAKALQYVRVKGTERLKRAGSDVKAEQPKITGDTASIAIEILPSAQGAKPLPSGTVVILVFKVAANAPEKTWPVTAEEVRAWGPLPKGESLTAASARAARFIVTPPGLPILSCFFYMH